jgi:hypothetical protein
MSVALGGWGSIGSFGRMHFVRSVQIDGSIDSFMHSVKCGGRVDVVNVQIDGSIDS